MFHILSASVRTTQTMAEDAAIGNDAGGIGKPRDLGLAPIIAEFINDFVNPQGRMVFIVETGYVSDPEDRNWQDAPTKFESTIIDVFSSETAARACLREEMTENFLTGKVWFEDDSTADATWADFYCGGGTTEQKDSAIQSLLDGEEGAESKFKFPWTEDAHADMDKNRTLFACCGELSKFSRDGDDGVGHDDADGTRLPFHWYCNEDWGDVLVIRALLVKNSDSIINRNGSSEASNSHRIKRRRTVLQSPGTAVKEADGKDIVRSLGLGLTSMVAGLVNDFIGPQGRTVYIVETGYVRHKDVRNWQDAPTEFQSTVIDVFSTVEAARACLRKVMVERILTRNVLIKDKNYRDDASGYNNCATWGEFYSCGGTSSDKKLAIQSLCNGHEGAEEKFDFPWLEDGDSERLFFTCCGSLIRIPRGDDETDDDDDGGEVSWMYHWYCERDSGHTLVIREVHVK